MSKTDLDITRSTLRQVEDEARKASDEVQRLRPEVEKYNALEDEARERMGKCNRQVESYKNEFDKNLSTSERIREELEHMELVRMIHMLPFL